MTRMVDAVAPARMGNSFRWLLGSFWVSNLGDGIALAAGPLLVASQTGDPLLVAMAAILQRLPWVLFGLHAGVFADRHDRRLLTIVVNLVRAAVLAVLAATIAADAVNVAVVLAAMFALGAAETFADITSSTLMPMLVQPADLGVANARLGAGMITLNQLVGPPLGAVLFTAGMLWPSVAQAAMCALAAVLIARIALPATPPRAGSGAVAERRERTRHEIGEGVRWLWNHPPIRTLTITVVSFNLTFGAATAVLVLLAERRLDSGEVGFGLITTAGAIGGIAGSSIYPWLERTLGMDRIMRAGLLIETATHLVLANATVLWVVLVVMLLFGVHEAAWGTTVITLRQRAVPTELQGRIASVYMIGVMGGLVVGGAIGGVIAGVWGVTAPYWFAFVGSGLILIVIWPRLRHLVAETHDTEPGTV